MLVFSVNKLWPYGQAVKTPPSHGGIRSSILLRATNLSSIRNFFYSSGVMNEKRKFEKYLLFWNGNFGHFVVYMGDAKL